SAAASIILYCVGITDIDPLRHRLVFERFLNLERREMPDIDMDFADDRRDEILRYVAEKYGHDRVAQIITFGTMGAKAAVRDSGRALGMSYADTDRVARLVPFALGMTLDRALEESPQLKQAYELDPSIRNLIETARGLEGVARHASTHAAGVVISHDPLVEHVPLQRPARGDDPDALPTTQYAMEQVAQIGLLKMDFLGLSNLTILARAVELIRQTQGIDLDLLELPENDAKTYEMLARGETFGVFQLESGGMRRAIQELRPESIGELAAMVALYRPGPMQHIGTYCRAKHGEEPIEYPHPDLAEILDETYGVIVYQDQVLLIAQKFAGYTLGEADVMRKAMGKKIPEKMRAERDRFLAGARARGYDEETAANVFDLIEPFAGYAFNKAHAVCYGTIAYQTAYLKANYPVEYLTAVLMQAPNQGTPNRVAAAVAECIRLGIPVLPPDVNRSGETFSIEQLDDGRMGIRFGLADIKNVGQGAAEEIIAARIERGPFASIEDFCRRIGMRQANKRTLESMIKAGALDCLAGRRTLLANIDRISSLAQREQRLRETGQSTMFDLFGDTQSFPLPALDLQPLETPLTEALAWEKELLGVHVSEHPLTRAAAALAPYVTTMASEIGPDMAGRDAVLAGSVERVRLLSTKQGRPFCAVELEDFSGSVEVTVWPDVYEPTADLWQQGNILLAYVRVRERDDRVNLAVQRVAQYLPDSEQLALDLDPAEWTVSEARRGVRELPPVRGGANEGEPAGDTNGSPQPAMTPSNGNVAPSPKPAPQLLRIT
ncbi:MAG TPA: DNA polymerase III subunit alpha, partial [Dehalococcoidia bacterium]|nr:DNA polymerase III subunit alpha [Dehalococcoidia bacterium]